MGYWKNKLIESMDNPSGIICPKCKRTDLIELDESFDDMTDGQCSDYMAGFNHSFTCPNCGHSELRNVEVCTADDEEFEDFEISSEYYLNALANKADIGFLIHDQVKYGNYKDNVLLKRLFYLNIITILESYLSDAFKYNVLNNDKFLIKFINVYLPFKNHIKYTLPEIVNSNNINYNLKDFLKKEVKKELNDIIFHKLELVCSLFKVVFGVEFESSWKDLLNNIIIRHHLVHRNGKDEDGNIIEITEKDLDELEERVFKFIDDVENKLKSVVG